MIPDGHRVPQPGDDPRLEAAGQLVNDIAHDLNNTLLVIRGYTSVLRSTLDDASHRRDLDEISKAADHAAGLTRRLLELARPPSGDEVERPGSDTIEHGTETILIVEDEEPVRKLVCRVLESMGYRVLQAAKPSEAQALLESDESIDLLVTDVVMPEMNGFELAAVAIATRPAMRTLFMSGNAYVTSGSMRSDTELLKKPFRPADLAQAVRRSLDDERVVVKQ